MKIAAMASLLILAVIVCGCTSMAPAAAPVATHTDGSSQIPPDLMGTWTGPTMGYELDVGFTNYGNTTMSMIITEQQGRIFAGTFVFGSGNGTQTIPFSGVIGIDGKTLTIPQKSGGYSFGGIVAPGKIELIYVKDGTHYSSSINMLKKV